MHGSTQSEQEILRELFEKAPLPYQSLDASGCILRVNEAWLKLVGYTEDEVVGRSIASFLTSDSAHRLAGRFEQFVTSGQVKGADFTIVRKDGSHVPIEVDGTIARGESGEFQRTHCIVRDVSRERVAMAGLAESERRYRTLVETAQEGIWQVDHAGDTVYVNPAMARMLGYGAEEMVGCPLLGFVDPEGVDRARQCLDRQAAGRTGQSDIPFRTKDGRTLVTVLAMAPLTGRDGAFSGAIAGVIDITDRVRFNRKMLDAQKMESLAVMAGGIAHDFNNLLQTIMGNADLALIGPGPGTGMSRDESLRAIVAAANQASGLCQQMLAYAGKGDYAKETVRVEHLIREMSGLLKSSVSRKVTLQLEPGKDLPAVEADPVQLRQVLLNLVTNASEAVGQGQGTVEVAVDTRDLDSAEVQRLFIRQDVLPGPYVVLTVRDDGCGMAADVVGSVFDPFFTTKFTGRGLGMAVVRGVAHAHGGGVAIDSSPGQGTTVEVYLPAQAHSMTDAALVAESVVGPGAAARGGRVLLADDEVPVLQVAVRMLEHLGWHVSPAADGEMAAAAVEAAPGSFDLVILDWSMPVLDGREALVRIRSAAPGLPVLISSGHAAGSVRDRFLDLEPDGYLEKPFLMDRLRAVVAAYVPGRE